MDTYVLQRALAGEIGLTPQEWGRAFEARLRYREDWHSDDLKAHWRVAGLKVGRHTQKRPGLKAKRNPKAREDIPFPHAQHLPSGVKDHWRREWAEARTLQAKRKVFSGLEVSRKECHKMTPDEQHYWLLGSKQYDGVSAEQAARELGLEAPRVTVLRAEAKLRPKPPKPTSVSCAECGDDFIPKRSTARFCGGACRLRAHRARAA